MKVLKVVAIIALVLFVAYELVIAFMPEWMIVGIHIRHPYRIRSSQPVVVQVFRDPGSPIGRELDRRFYDLNTQKISLPSGKGILIATIEPSDYQQMLRDRIGDLRPEIIVLDSPADAGTNPLVEREAAHAVNVCAAVRACPAVVPAFIPSWVSNAEKLQAARQVMDALGGK